jgi:hypothetical protein
VVRCMGSLLSPPDDRLVMNLSEPGAEM